MVSTRRIELLLTIAAALGLAGRCSAQDAIPAADTAWVHLKVNTAYDDSPRSLQVLSTIVKYAPWVQVPVAAGSNLSTIFVNTYGFGVADLPKSYALMLRAILDKNHLATPEDLLPGSLVVPPVPPRVMMKYNPANLTTHVANIMEFPSKAVIAASSATNRAPRPATVPLREMEVAELAYNMPPPVEALNLYSPTTFLALQVAVPQAAALADSTAFDPGTVTTGTYPLTVKLADGNCDSEPPERDRPILNPAQRTRIAQLLQGSQRSPVVFILDTGWPRLQAYQDSVNALSDVLNTVWMKKFNLPFSRTGLQTTIPAASNQHCRCIQRGLQELVALQQNVDAAKRVRVIYVPLTREQGAATVLTDLVQTSMLIQSQDLESVLVTPQVAARMRPKARDRVMQYFPEKWVGEQVKTDKSILDAILLIGQAYAEAADSLFFVNESWTVDHAGPYKYVMYQGNEYGLVLAAAGNDSTTNLLDFAERSLGSTDTMAILNMTAAGPDPSSTLIDPNYVDAATAAGFDGRVTDDIFGTSFAAPRVAFLLAAGEAVRPPGPLHRITSFGTDLKMGLQQLRLPGASNYMKLLFDPVRYIEKEAAVNSLPRSP